MNLFKRIAFRISLYATGILTCLHGCQEAPCQTITGTEIVTRQDALLITYDPVILSTLDHFNLYLYSGLDESNESLLRVFTVPPTNATIQLPIWSLMKSYTNGAYTFRSSVTGLDSIFGGVPDESLETFATTNLVLFWFGHVQAPTAPRLNSYMVTNAPPAPVPTNRSSGLTVLIEGKTYDITNLTVTIKGAVTNLPGTDVSTGGWIVRSNYFQENTNQLFADPFSTSNPPLPK